MIDSDRFDELPDRPDIDQPAISKLISGLFVVIKRQFRLIMAITLVTSAVSMFGIIKLKTYYTATSSVILDQRHTRPLATDAQRANALPVLNPDGEVELLKSDNVALRVVRSLRLDEDPEFVPPPGRLTRIISAISEWFPSRSDDRASGINPSLETIQEAAASSSDPKGQGSTDEAAKPISGQAARALRNLTSRTEIRRRGLSDVIAIHVSSINPGRAAQIANAYAAAYLEEQVAPKIQAIERSERVLSRQLDELDRELKRSEVQFGLRQVYQETQLRLRTVMQQRDAVTPDARIASTALPPGAGGLALTKIIAVLGSILASLALALGISYLRDLHTRRVQTGDELEHVSGVPNLSAIPRLTKLKIPKGAHPADVISKSSRCGYANAIRRLCLNIHFMRKQQSRSLTVLLTSVKPKEGRTTLALSMARSAAAAGARTLVIDSDFRSPELHKTLGLRNELGFADLLERSFLEQSAIQRDPASTCSIITIGSLERQSHNHLLHPDRLRPLFRELEPEFDLIIIDTAPVELSADALALGPIADLTLLAVRTGWADPKEIQSSIRQLRHINNQRVATVLNFA
jgi:capsular exopolysaccharide synthesis family protein